MQRRAFLKTTAALATVPSIEATTGGIPAPFDAMPTLEDPPERVRELAQVSLPPRAVPDAGPIPDYHHQHTVEAEITLPEWALEAARWRLVDHHDADDLDRWRVEEILMEYAYTRERYLTPDGRDAVAVLLDHTGAGNGGDTDD
jgi:hypothetical protein